MRGYHARAVLLGGIVVLAAPCGGGDGSGSSAGGRGEPVSMAARCVQSYNGHTLSKRSFAFDGTVVATEIRADPNPPEGERGVPWVTFRVHRWFRGGSGARVGIWIDGLGVETSVGTIAAEPGTRLLVAGEPRWGGEPLDDPVAWTCGFTQPWTARGAAE